jgi:molybdenum cofactor synthesis domain-containing protein
MIVEILCAGNELLSGITLNTNAHWLAGQVARAGAIVARVTTVRDDLREISAAVRESLSRDPDVLVTTGGLGATYDDMTLEGVAIALGKKVTKDDRAVEMLKRSYARRKLNYELNEVRLKMATIPEGSTPLENMVGSAPAVMDDSGRTRIFCLQGVPLEMQEEFTRHILPAIKQAVGNFVSEEINYEVLGVTEAMIAPALARIVESNPRDVIYLKTHPQGYEADNTPHIRVHLVSSGSDHKQVRNKLDAVADVIRQEVARLGGRIT